MPSVPLSQLEARVYSSLDGNQLEFPERFVRAALNEGLARLNLILGYNQVTLPIAGTTGNFTVAGQREYNVPAGILIPIRVDFEGTEIQRLSLERLARAYRTWAVDTSTYMGPPARWASIGLKQFVIHPIDADGGSSLEVTGIANITPLVNQDDVVTLEDQFTEILIMYAKTRVMAKEPGKPFADQARQLQEMWKTVRKASIWKVNEWPLYWYGKQQRPNSGRFL